MGKRKFSVGEFVCAINYEERLFYYIYDYVAHRPMPYCLLGITGGIYTAKAKDLKPIAALDDLLNKILLGIRPDLLVAAKDMQSRRYSGAPLNWNLDLRVRRD